VAPGASVTLTLTIDVPPTTRSVTNPTAVAATSDTDPDDSDNSLLHTTSIATDANLRIGVRDTPDPVVAGAVMTYSMLVTNDGPTHANEVVLRHPLDDVTLLAAVPEVGSCAEADNELSCSLGDMAPDVDYTVSVSVRVDPSVRDSLSVQTSVVAVEDDSDADNSVADTDTVVEVLTDGAVTLAVTPARVVAGLTTTRAFTVANEGPSEAAKLTLELAIPEGTAVSAISVADGSCTNNDELVSCVLASIGPARSIHGSVTFDVDPAHRETLTFDAQLLNEEPDRNDFNDTDSLDVSIDTQVELSTTLTSRSESVPYMGQITYDGSITNSGVTAALEPTATFEAPEGSEVVVATPSTGSCAIDGTTTTCTLPAMPPGARLTFTAVVVLGAANRGTVEATFGVDSDEHDTDSSNNGSTASVTVDDSVDLQVELVHSPDRATAGGLGARRV